MSLYTCKHSIYADERSAILEARLTKEALWAALGLGRSRTLRCRRAPRTTRAIEAELSALIARCQARGAA